MSTSDIGGGAEKIAWNLLQSYRQMGQRSQLAVANKLSSDIDVLKITNDVTYNRWACFCQSIIESANFNGHLNKFLNFLRQPSRYSKLLMGCEDFEFPDTKKLLDFNSNLPDIIHCHNLHGGYFDLRLLPWLSHKVPLILTLHDAWMLSGHCAHSFDCDRWMIGCGKCPDLSVYPAIRRDATAYNWKRKRDIYARSKFYVATPCRWLMKKVNNSILLPAIADSRVIPNGVDLKLFHPYEQNSARKALGLPLEPKILLFTASGIKRNIWKDYETLRKAVSIVSRSSSSKNILFIGLGENAAYERNGRAEMRFVPFQNDPMIVARYYQAADVYIHAARIDTFPNTVLEALACGIPVVATDVGGIPEQIIDGYTGFIVPQKDPYAMASRISLLISDEESRKKMSIAAAEDAKNRFNLDIQARAFLGWYRDIINTRE